MSFKPHGTLRNRSFIGMLIAQFQAAFSDQAIQASAMFYAIRLETMPKSLAIGLLPILFYSPWAIFVTWAGYLSDKYSKQYAIRFWKVVEVGIVLVTFVGFYLGSVVGQMQGVDWARYVGSYLVMSTVFLMGMQSAFFVPAKYGVMPEMLQPHLLSKGNGLLESLSFLAIILGTVAGGILIWVFSRENGLPYHEPWLGVILIGLSLIGASCSFMVERMPAANPDRQFPFNPLTPIIANCQTFLRSRPLLFAVLGIAFFTFMVAFTRNTMYMHGESRIDRWSSLETSLVVGVVAFGIGLGSPLAGYLSGGKVELGLVPLGGLGMILALVACALVLNVTPILVICVTLIGFFTGFYIVPLFTLLQHRAPKNAKGDLVATSNFINVIGAILATLLFLGVVQVSKWVGVIEDVATEIPLKGELIKLDKDQNGKLVDFEIRDEKTKKKIRYSQWRKSTLNPDVERTVLHQDGLLKEESADTPGTTVAVLRSLMEHDGAFPWHDVSVVEHHQIQPETSSTAVTDEEGLPRYLFLGAAVMTLIILILLRRQLPDLYSRTLLWLRATGRYHLKIVGVQNLPQEDAAILATNCDTHEMALQVVAVTDRSISFLLLPNPNEKKPGFQLRYLARRTETLDLPASDGDANEWNRAVSRGVTSLNQGYLLGLTAEAEHENERAERLLQEVRAASTASIIPVWCGTLTGEVHAGQPLHNVRVVIGEPVRPDASIDAIRRRIHLLGEWIQQTEDEGAIASTSVMPQVTEATAAKEKISGKSIEE